MQDRCSPVKLQAHIKYGEDDGTRTHLLQLDRLVTRPLRLHPHGAAGRTRTYMVFLRREVPVRSASTANMACPVGFEPTFTSFVEMQLSPVSVRTHKNGAGYGNRTRIFSLEGCNSTVELSPLKNDSTFKELKNGAPGWNRTTLVRRQRVYSPSQVPACSDAWSPGKELNLRRVGLQPTALPLSYRVMVRSAGIEPATSRV